MGATGGFERGGARFTFKLSVNCKLLFVFYSLFNRNCGTEGGGRVIVSPLRSRVRFLVRRLKDEMPENWFS